MPQPITGGANGTGANTGTEAGIFAGVNKVESDAPNSYAAGLASPGFVPPLQAFASADIAARFTLEIARAAAVGRRLALAGSSLMSTLPPGASDDEVGLHLIHENVSRFERAVRTLELTMDELPSSNGD